MCRPVKHRRAHWYSTSAALGAGNSRHKFKGLKKLAATLGEDAESMQGVSGSPQNRGAVTDEAFAYIDVSGVHLVHGVQQTSAGFAGIPAYFLVHCTPGAQSGDEHSVIGRPESGEALGGMLGRCHGRPHDVLIRGPGKGGGQAHGGGTRTQEDASGLNSRPAGTGAWCGQGVLQTHDGRLGECEKQAVPVYPALLRRCIRRQSRFRDGSQAGRVQCLMKCRFGGGFGQRGHCAHRGGQRPRKQPGRRTGDPDDTEKCVVIGFPQIGQRALDRANRASLSNG